MTEEGKVQYSVTATLVFEVYKEDVEEFIEASARKTVREFFQATLDTLAFDDLELQSGVVLSVEPI